MDNLGSKRLIFDIFVYREIPQGKSLFLTIETTSCAGTDTEVNYLEHVQAVITLNATRRGDVELFMRYCEVTNHTTLSRNFLEILYLPAFCSFDSLQ